MTNVSVWGGVLYAYHDKIDVLCINSSGVKYSFNTEEADTIAKERCKEFYSTMNLAGVKKSWIAEIYGTPPMFLQIAQHFDDYISHFDFKSYDIIFVPQQFDEHREHRFIGNYFVKEILKFTGYKPSLTILRYEVWGTIRNPNFYFDITKYVAIKTKLIQNYVSRSKANYADKILALNRYRTCIPFLNQNDKYVEAFNKQSISDYLNEPDDLTWSFYE